MFLVGVMLKKAELISVKLLQPLLQIIAKSSSKLKTKTWCLLLVAAVTEVSRTLFSLSTEAGWISISGYIYTCLKQAEKLVVDFFVPCAADFKVVMETFAPCHHSLNYTGSFWLDTQCWGEDWVAREEWMLFSKQIFLAWFGRTRVHVQRVYRWW